MQNRFKSKVLWIAIISQLMLVLSLYFSPDMTEQVRVLLISVVEVCTITGILHSPKEK